MEKFDKKMQEICGLQVLFRSFNCQTPVLICVINALLILSADELFR